jgi:hypothetical protein
VPWKSCIKLVKALTAIERSIWKAKSYHRNCGWFGRTWAVAQLLAENGLYAEVTGATTA